MAIILMLGSSVMATSVLSHQMRSTNATYVDNAYLSEAGLDEAYALAILTYHQAIEIASEKSNALLDSIVQDQIAIQSDSLDYYHSTYFTYLDHASLALKQNVLDQTFKDYFSTLYYESYLACIETFQSQIDEGIQVVLVSATMSGNKLWFLLQSTYKEHGIPRHHQFELQVIPPNLSYFQADDPFDLLTDSAIMILNWRIVYGE